MDVVNHTIAGAATGALFGHPILGAIAGALPDVMLIGPRRQTPPVSYDLAHSPLMLWAAGLVSVLLGSWAVIAAVASHLFLDLFTHGREWGPLLAYPLSDHRYSLGDEWEWFSSSWWRGFWITLAWSIVCLGVSLV